MKDGRSTVDGFPNKQITQNNSLRIDETSRIERGKYLRSIITLIISCTLYRILLYNIIP